MKTFQEIVAKLTEFWAKQGCLIFQPYDVEKGAGTFHPATFLRCLGPEPIMAAYIEPCRRPKDGRYGTNPNRLQHYFQYQVILKPAPYNIQDLYLQSLEAIGLDLKKHDIRFVHDDWESPTLGAWGLGWEVWIDGQESTQFTYFQSVAGIPLSPITGEITYGIERIAMYLQNVDSMFDIQWNEHYTYGDIYKRNEEEFSEYNFEKMDAKMWLKHFEEYEKEAKRLAELKLPLPALDFVIKASHAFNMLDARGVISVTERASYIANIRNIARQVADAYIESREQQGFPLLKRISPEMHIPQHEKTPPFKDIDQPQDFLLEIGCEELPATFVQPGLDSLERLVKAALDTEEISYSSITTAGTPRRLALLIHNLAPGRKAHTVEKKGPSLEHAFKDGQLQPAGQGFFRSLGKEPLSLDAIKKGHDPEIQIRDIKNTSYLFATQTVAELKTWKLLQKVLPECILGIDFPKKMRWADLEITFARPLRWIVSLYGHQVIPFTVGPIASSNRSYGHRQLSPEAFVIKGAHDYFEVLKSKHVLVDIKERKREIEKQIAQIEKETSAQAVRKERVIGEVLHLVEWPFLTATEFKSDFLKAPKEVLISEMVEHQRYFPLEDTQGHLKNIFVITANVPPTESIRHGNRKVISARLSDGVFLYEQDLKTPLEQFNEKLKGTIFQKGLGSIYDKVERLQKHTEHLLRYFPQASKEHVKLAASLAKADLATEMVGEFPELQGAMGRIYAEKQGKPKEVALSLDEQWMPKGEGSPLPATTTGTILSLADKLDNCIGFFGLDLKPTSSSDPFALRRQGLGLIRILITNKISLSLAELLRECIKAFPPAIQAKKDTLIPEIITFLQTRAKSVLQDLGFLKGEIDACIQIRNDNFYDIFCRLEALHAFRKEDCSFNKLIEVHKRCEGQINGLKPMPFQETSLQETEEKKLYSSLKERSHPFEQAISSMQYAKALELLSELQLPLAHLFDNVKILADDEKLKTNRLALLQLVAKLFHEVADFQKIQEK